MRHDGRWAARQWRRIEDEYDEPAREVVRVLYHEMRLPMRQVAELLYVSETTLRGWCKAWDISTYRSGYTKRAVDGRVFLRARALGFDDISQAIAHYRASGLRWEDIQGALRCGSATISRHIPDGAKGRYNQSEVGRQAHQQAARDLNARMDAAGARGGFARWRLSFSK